MKRIALLASIGAIVVAALLPAVTQGHGSRWLIHSGGGQGRAIDHHNLVVCDNSVDGHEVWIGFYDSGRNVYDKTGHAPSGGCTYAWIAWDITRFRVCISYEGCTGFLPHSSWRPR